MHLTQKLKSFERQIVFIRWGSSAEYGKIKYVGQDYIEFETIDKKTLHYSKTVLINPNLILEVVLGSTEVNRVIAAVSCNMPSSEVDN